MMIEKLNDNQIRCTLTKEDLASRNLQIGELAYGSEKAKSLFQDMMQQAARECGFDAEDMPLMVEAIPYNAGSIVLIITKVEDPSELDTRYARFTPAPETEDNTDEPQTDSKLDGAEEFLNLLDKVKNAVAKPPEEEKKATPPQENPTVRLFSFAQLDNLIGAAKFLNPIYDGSSSLFKHPKSGLYVLAITKSNMSTEEFYQISNMLSEFGNPEKASSASLSYLKEHCTMIAFGDAIIKLASL